MTNRVIETCGTISKGLKLIALKSQKERRNSVMQKKIFQEIIKEIKIWFFEKISKIGKPVARLTKKKEERHKSRTKIPISGMKWLKLLQTPYILQE